MTTPDTLDQLPPSFNFAITSPDAVTPPIDLSDAPDATIPTDIVDLTKTDHGYTVSNISASQEETRAKIAWTFTMFFLLTITLALTFPFVANLITPKYFDNPIEAAKALLTTISSILAGPFGFIVGFYFKQNSNNN